MRQRHNRSLGLASIMLAAALQACAPHLTEPKNFMVFFPKDTADLTPEGSQIVAQAASAAAQSHPSRIIVEGRADGGTPHDATIAHERARAVTHALVDAGVDAKTIAEHPGAPPAGVTGVAAHEVIVTLTP